MDSLSSIFTRFEVHILWALALVAVAVLVKFWPAIKAWGASRWAALKSALAEDEKEAKAVGELALQDIHAKWLTAFDSVAAEVRGLKVRIETAEKNFTAAIDAQVKADEAKASAVVQVLEDPALAPEPVFDVPPPAPALRPEAPEVHGWVPPVASR